ncbi:MAG: Trk family potassium uptake protein [Candidatus Omnitrophica bacterium]|nr:Trk family potassium uptake protein [Candidatus Omnitrophota bacterium]
MKLKPPQVVVLSFLIAIIIGTALLSLPIASEADGGVTLIDRLFTATSATCVTGLIVRDTPSAWTHFGQAVIFFLFQIGGLGIMTLSTFFAVLLGRKLTIRQNVVIQSALDHNRVYGAKKLILYIIGLTVLVEAAGAIALFARWSLLENWSVGERMAKALFHSVSAFCNAGFSLFPDSFIGYNGDVSINIIMMMLIFVGGLGFFVILDMLKAVFGKKEYKASHLSLQSKIVLASSSILIIIGALSIFLLESNNSMGGFTLKTRFLGSFFQSVTSRTAGFNTFDIGKFAPSTLLLLILLMFIGASPGSTGGGIKTCTLVIVLASVYSMSKNRDRVFLLGRTIPRTVVRRAILIFIIAFLWIFIATLVFVVVEKDNLGGSNIVIMSLFEVTSAFGTVGLSTGITPQLTTLGKLIIIITMFAGRIGPLTLALAVAINEEKSTYIYPEERAMVG